MLKLVEAERFGRCFLVGALDSSREGGRELSTALCWWDTDTRCCWGDLSIVFRLSRMSSIYRALSRACDGGAARSSGKRGEQMTHSLKHASIVICAQIARLIDWKDEVVFEESNNRIENDQRQQRYELIIWQNKNHSKRERRGAGFEDSSSVMSVNN